MKSETDLSLSLSSCMCVHIFGVVGAGVGFLHISFYC